MRRALLAALVILLCVAVPAHAAVTLEVENSREVFVPAGSAGEVVARVPFSLDVRGLVYAKMLVTPWNAVNAGTPNGTVASGEGVSGWWISFTFTNSSGAALTKDAANRPASPSSGPFVDSTATPAILLDPAITWFVEAKVRYPASAATPGAYHRVVFAVVFRDAEAVGAGGSGGTLEQSRGFTFTIRVPGTPGQTTGGKSGADSPGTNGTGTTGEHGGGEAAAVALPGFALPSGLAGTLVVAGVALAFLALIVSTFAAVLAAWGTMEVLREVRGQRRGGGPSDGPSPPSGDEQGRSDDRLER